MADHSEEIARPLDVTRSTTSGRFNVATFVSNLNGNGILHSTDYQMQFPIPRTLIGQNIVRPGQSNMSYSDVTRLMSMRTSNAAVPGVALKSSPINRYGAGPTEKMPYSAGFTETSVEFIADKNGDIWAFWYLWMNSIFNFADPSHVTNSSNARRYTANYKSDYVTDITIRLYDRGGILRQAFVLVDAFPESINEVPLGWGMNNHLIHLTVGLTFKEWYMVSTSSQPPSANTSS